MSYELPGTLAWYSDQPHFKLWSAANIQSAWVAKSCAEYTQHCNKVKPEAEALEFYALNHLAAMIRKEFSPYDPLPAWADEVMKKYFSVVAEQSKRLFFYITLICTREGRHLHQHSMSPVWWAEVESKFGSPFRKFCDGLPGNEHAAVERFMSDPPAISIASYAAGLSYIFHKGKWSSSYGGPKWGNIADTLSRFVSGAISSEVMVDTAYTLAHNGGPMFNKGIAYHHQNNDKLYTILDVQRAGQVPSLILSGELPEVPQWLINMIQGVASVIGGIPFSVDWKQVMALGAVKNYAHKIPVSPTPAPKVSPVSPLPKGAVAKGEFFVMPNKSVTQFKRAA